MSDKILDFLQPFWADTIKQLTDNLLRNDRLGRNRFASGVTSQSIGLWNEEPITILAKDNYRVQIFMPSYYAYIDEGVQGAANFADNRRQTTGRFAFRNLMPPWRGINSPIRKFMLNRGIIPDNFRKAKDKEKALDSLAFVIARGIYRRGIERTDFYSDVVNDALIARLEQGLLNAAAEQIFEIIEIKR